MNHVALTTILIFSLLFFSSSAFAEINSNDPQKGSNQLNPLNNPSSEPSTMGPVMQPQFNFGMPAQSNADPEYVAQQKMVEGMTTAYNWVSLNTSRFSEGCKTNKDDLIKEISKVVQSSQEAATTCRRFDLEAQDCNPELFCSVMTSGKVPLPPQTKLTMKKLGYDPDTIKAEEITQELIIKVCIEQTNSELSKKVEMSAASRKSIEDQLPKFRTSCEEFMKNQGGDPNVQLPTFNYSNIQTQYAPGTGPNQPMNPQNQQPMQPMQNGGQQQPKGCSGSAPNCDSGPAPFCQNGNWICPQGSGNQTPGQPPLMNPPATETVPAIEQPAAQTPPAEPAVIPEAPPIAEPPATTAQTMGRTTNDWITGLFGALFEETAVCGNGICEPGKNESPQSCPKDCQASGNNMAPQNNQGMGRPPEQLCKMTDEEIIAEYLGNSDSDIAFEKQRNEYRCKQESTRALDEINNYKMQSAMCKADAALDCEAKKQAVKTCNELKDSPEKIATMIVNNLCRRFISTDDAKKNRLLDLANQFNQKDPALASQLGDTAEKNSEDQKNLNFLSYLIGDGNYAQKIQERTDKLKTIRDKLALEGSDKDQETISIIDSQISDLEKESSTFGNALDLTRWGYMIGR